MHVLLAHLHDAGVLPQLIVLENGGSPEKAARSALTSAIDAYIKQQGKYNKNESGIKWQDVQDCLVLVTNCFSTQTSYENQTKKPSTTALSSRP